MCSGKVTRGLSVRVSFLCIRNVTSFLRPAVFPPGVDKSSHTALATFKYPILRICIFHHTRLRFPSRTSSEDMKEFKCTLHSENRRSESDSMVTAQYVEFCSQRYTTSRDGTCELENEERTAEDPSKGRMYQTPAHCYINLYTMTDL